MLPDFLACYESVCQALLLKVEREGDNLAARLLRRIGIHEAVGHARVGETLRVLGVEIVHESVAELKLGTELEEREIEVAAHAHLEEKVVTLKLDVVGVASGEVEHRVEAGHEIRTVVVEAGRTEDKLHCGRHVDGLQLLRLGDVLPVARLVGEVGEADVARSEIHSRSETEGEVRAKAQLAEHSNGESRVPAVLVNGDHLLNGAVVGGHQLRTNVRELKILQVGAHHNSEVERAQVGVRAVLHPRVLCRDAERKEQQ